VSKKSFRPESHRQNTQVRLIVLGFLLLLGIGGSLVWFFYGSSAAFTAVACLVVFGGVLGLLWLLLTLMEMWVKEDDA
jgi:hypothetical protein